MGFIEDMEAMQSNNSNTASSDFVSDMQLFVPSQRTLDDVINDYHSTYDQNEEELNIVEEPEVEEVDTTEHDDFIRGVLRGWEGTKSMAGGAAALLGEMFNSEDLKEWGLDYYQEHEQEASQYDKAKFTEDPLDWIQGTLGELAPTMAQSMVGAFIGGIAGGGVGSIPGALTGLAGKKVLAKSVEKLFTAKMKTKYAAKLIADEGKEVAEAKIKKQAEKAIAKSIGAKVGLVGATAQMEIGGNYGEASDEYGEDASVTAAIATGMTSALLELAGGNIRIIDKVLGADTAKVFKKAIGTKDAGLITRIAKEAVKQAPAEAMQESMQEFMSLVNLKGNDSEYEIWTKENVMRMAEAAGAGLTGGLAFGAFTGIAPNPKTYEDYKKEAQEHAAKTVVPTGDKIVDQTNMTNAENEYLAKAAEEVVAARKARAEKKSLSFLKGKDQEVNDLDNAIAKSTNKVRNLEKVIASNKAKGTGLDKIVEGYANAVNELENLKKQRGDKDEVFMKSVDEIVEEQAPKPDPTHNSIEPTARQTLAEYQTVSAEQEKRESLLLSKEALIARANEVGMEPDEFYQLVANNYENNKARHAELEQKINSPEFRAMQQKEKDKASNIKFDTVTEVDFEEEQDQEVTTQTKEATNDEAMSALLGEAPPAAQNEENAAPEQVEIKEETVETKQAPKIDDTATNKAEPIQTPSGQEVVGETVQNGAGSKTADVIAKEEQISELEERIYQAEDDAAMYREEGNEVDAVAAEKEAMDLTSQVEALKKEVIPKAQERVNEATSKSEQENQEAAVVKNAEEIKAVKEEIAALEKTNPTTAFAKSKKRIALQNLNTKLSTMEKDNGKQTTTNEKGTKENQEASKATKRNRTKGAAGNLQKAEKELNNAKAEYQKIVDSLAGKEATANSTDKPASLVSAENKVKKAQEKYDMIVEERNNQKEQDQITTPEVKISGTNKIYKVAGKEQSGKKIEVEGFEDQEFIAVEDTKASKAGSQKVYNIIESETGNRILQVTGYGNIKTALSEKLGKISRKDFDKAKKSRLSKTATSAVQEKSNEETINSIPQKKVVEISVMKNGKVVKQKINAREALKTLLADHDALTKALHSPCLKG